MAHFSFVAVVLFAGHGVTRKQHHYYKTEMRPKRMGILYGVQCARALLVMSEPGEIPRRV